MFAFSLLHRSTKPDRKSLFFIDLMIYLAPIFWTRNVPDVRVFCTLLVLVLFGNICVRVQFMQMRFKLFKNGHIFVKLLHFSLFTKILVSVISAKTPTPGVFWDGPP